MARSSPTVQRRSRREVAGAGTGAFSGLLAPMVTTLDSVVRTGVRRSPFQRDPRLIAQIAPLLNAVGSYFAVRFRGWQNVPRDQPCLIVGNHSGGAETTDFWLFLSKWVAERGADAPLYSLAYNLIFGAPLLGQTLRRLGIIPANHGNARKALALGAPVVVFPGGDYEVFRSWSERNRIDFGGHMGFITLAISAGVPVVPMTIHGAHQSTLVLTRGQGIAHATGIDRLHVKVFPFILNIPFGLTPAFVPSVQLPSKVTVHFGAPLDWSHHGARRSRDPAVLKTCYDEITMRMQKTLDRLTRETPHPVLARLRELDLGATVQQLEGMLGIDRAPSLTSPTRGAIRRRMPRAAST